MEYLNLGQAGVVKRRYKVLIFVGCFCTSYWRWAPCIQGRGHREDQFGLQRGHPMERDAREKVCKMEQYNFAAKRPPVLIQSQFPASRFTIFA